MGGYGVDDDVGHHDNDYDDDAVGHDYNNNGMMIFNGDEFAH